MTFHADSHFSAEVAGQPDDWERVSARLGEYADRLPTAGRRLAVIGCGTSWFVAQAYAALREESGHGETDAFAASEFRIDRGYDEVLVLSRSGTTTECVEVLERLRTRGTTALAIVATPGTAIPDLADRVVVLDDVDEESVVQTRFATSTLALLRASLGHDLSSAVADARAVLAEDEASATASLAGAEQLTFLGRGWTVGLAEEAALKLRESSQSWAESYPAMEYRHGPISIATSGRAVWAMGDVPAGLAGQIAATGAHLEHRDVDPLAELVRVHRLCLVKARQADLDLDRPRHLTRSVILEPNPVTSTSRVVLAVDVGGTQIKAALVTSELQVVVERSVATPADLGDSIGDVVAAVLDDLRAEGSDRGLEVVGCGVVVPGIVDEAAQVARRSVNLGWRDVRIADAVAGGTGLATVLGHDVRAALLAETRIGAARGARDALLIALGTGIAGAAMIDGRMLDAGGWAGELGHVVVDPRGPECTCGASGCLEAMASASAVARAYAARTGVSADARIVAGLVNAGNADATQVWGDTVEALARGVVTAVALTGVELVLIGGGLIGAGETLLAPLRAAVADQLTFHRPPRIEAAALGNRAGCVGAACLAWDANNC